MLHLGGEACIAEVNTINPSKVRSCGALRKVGMLIPNHVSGVGISIPIGINTLDLLNSESTPPNEASCREIGRVIRPYGTVHLRFFDDESYRQARSDLLDAGHPAAASRKGSVICFRFGGERNNSLG